LKNTIEGLHHISFMSESNFISNTMINNVMIKFPRLF